MPPIKKKMSNNEKAKRSGSHSLQLNGEPYTFEFEEIGQHCLSPYVIDHPLEERLKEDLEDDRIDQVYNEGYVFRAHMFRTSAAAAEKEGEDEECKWPEIVIGFHFWTRCDVNYDRTNKPDTVHIKRLKYSLPQFTIYTPRISSTKKEAPKQFTSQTQLEEECQVLGTAFEATIRLLNPAPKCIQYLDMYRNKIDEIPLVHHIEAGMYPDDECNDCDKVAALSKSYFAKNRYLMYDFMGNTYHTIRCVQCARVHDQKKRKLAQVDESIKELEQKRRRIETSTSFSDSD